MRQRRWEWEGSVPEGPTRLHSCRRRSEHLVCAKFNTCLRTDLPWRKRQARYLVPRMLPPGTCSIRKNMPKDVVLRIILNSCKDTYRLSYLGTKDDKKRKKKKTKQNKNKLKKKKPSREDFPCIREFSFLFFFFSFEVISMPNIGLALMTPKSRVTCSTN